MTLKEFLEANSDANALVTLTNDGDTAPFATVSAGSSDALSTTISGKTVSSFTVASPTKISATLTAGA